MSNAWDINNIRKVAGLSNLNESKKKTLTEGPWYDKDDNDDEDRDAKIASGDKRQKKFETRNKKEISAAEKTALAKDKDKGTQGSADTASDLKKNVDKATGSAESKKAQVKDDAKARVVGDSKESEKPKAAEIKKETEDAGRPAATGEAKRRGKAPNENSFNQQAKKYAKEHGRASFIKWAADTHGKGKNYASALFAKYNPKSSREVKESASEAWIISHPQLKSYTLCENSAMNQLQWIDANTDFNTMIFATEAEAKKTLKYIQEWKSWDGQIEHIEFEADAE